MLKIQGATVSREAALEERAHHIGIAAGRGSRQSALDGQVAPEPIEHDIDWTEDGILSLWRHDLQPLKIIKDGAHRFERGVSGITSGPTITQEAAQIA